LKRVRGMRKFYCWWSFVRGRIGVEKRKEEKRRASLLSPICVLCSSIQ